MPRRISRLLGLALLLAMIASPVMFTRGAVAQDAATPCPAPTEEDATALATAFAAAWNAHDASAVVAIYAPDAVFHWGIGADAEGADAIQASVEAFLTAFPTLHITVDRVWLAGDSVVIRYIAEGVQETDFQGVPASQTTVTWSGINVMQLACGLVVEQWGEADHFGRIEQQGVISVTSPEVEATPAA